MANISYKLSVKDEVYGEFNEGRVIRMRALYEIRLCVPRWFYLDDEIYKDQVFNNVIMDEDSGDPIERDGNIIYTFNYLVNTIAKCNTDEDYPDLTMGIYICETRAEIKALNKVKRIVNKLYSIIEKGDNKEEINSSIDTKLDKNLYNLMRLTGVGIEEEAENEDLKVE